MREVVGLQRCCADAVPGDFVRSDGVSVDFCARVVHRRQHFEVIACLICGLNGSLRRRPLDELFVVVERRRVNTSASDRLLAVLAQLATLNLLHLVEQEQVLVLDLVVSLLLLELAGPDLVLAELLLHLEVVCVHDLFDVLFVVRTIDHIEPLLVLLVRSNKQHRDNQPRSTKLNQMMKGVPIR